MSRIGNKCIEIPDKIKISIDGNEIKVEGPKGTLSHTMSARVDAKLEDGQLSFSRKSNTPKDKAFHGLTRSLVNNMVLGTSQGFKKTLIINGVGFKAAVKGKVLELSLGYSHPVNYPIPEDVQVKVEDNLKVTVEGIDKQRVGAVAADIRAYYPPEPYKGKGVRYDDEVIRRKEGKTAQGK
ncbi:MAG: 50S ribosomal protein L6 [Verrucomicrobiota bacterium]